MLDNLLCPVQSPCSLSLRSEIKNNNRNNNKSNNNNNEYNNNNTKNSNITLTTITMNYTINNALFIGYLFYIIACIEITAKIIDTCLISLHVSR